MRYHGVYVLIFNRNRLIVLSILGTRCIRITEDDTTSSSRVYIKNLFLELAEFLGLTKLNNRLTIRM